MNRAKEIHDEIAAAGQQLLNILIKYKDFVYVTGSSTVHVDKDKVIPFIIHIDMQKIEQFVADEELKNDLTAL